MKDRQMERGFFDPDGSSPYAFVVAVIRAGLGWPLVWLILGFISWYFTPWAL